MLVIDLRTNNLDARRVVAMKKGILVLFSIIALVISCSKGEETAKKVSGIIPFKLSELYIIYQNGKRGFIDRSGKIVISPQFDAANSFREDIALVNMGGV